MMDFITANTYVVLLLAFWPQCILPTVLRWLVFKGLSKPPPHIFIKRSKFTFFVLFWPAKVEKNIKKVVLRQPFLSGLTITTLAPQNCHIILKTTYTYPFEIAFTVLFIDSMIPELLLPQVNILFDNTQSFVYVFELNQNRDRCPTLDSFPPLIFGNPKWYRVSRENTKNIANDRFIFHYNGMFSSRKKTILQDNLITWVTFCVWHEPPEGK